MPFLAIDWGEKRVGIALSEDGVIAFPYGILENRDAIESIKSIVDEKEVGLIILGWPIGLSGNETDKTREVEIFYQELQKLNIPVKKIDERYSTKMIPREGRGLDMKDAVSAQILLQEYLDARKP